MKTRINHLGTRFCGARANGGFALLELLAVIAIITILADILAPVFENAREKARAAASIGSLRNIGVSQRMLAHVSHAELEIEELQECMISAMHGKTALLADTRWHRHRINDLMEENYCLQDEFEDAVMREKAATARKATHEALDALQEIEGGLKIVADYLTALEKLQTFAIDIP
jgi:prepilin-type N-terminal cleavage/methylation domain-containing protein